MSSTVSSAVFARLTDLCVAAISTVRFAYDMEAFLRAYKQGIPWDALVVGPVELECAVARYYNANHSKASARERRTSVRIWRAANFQERLGRTPHAPPAYDDSGFWLIPLAERVQIIASWQFAIAADERHAFDGLLVQYSAALDSIISVVVAYSRGLLPEPQASAALAAPRYNPANVQPQTECYPQILADFIVRVRHRMGSFGYDTITSETRLLSAYLSWKACGAGGPSPATLPAAAAVSALPTIDDGTLVDILSFVHHTPYTGTDSFSRVLSAGIHNAIVLGALADNSDTARLKHFSRYALILNQHQRTALLRHYGELSEAEKVVYSLETGGTRRLPPPCFAATAPQPAPAANVVQPAAPAPPAPPPPPPPPPPSAAPTGPAAPATPATPAMPAASTSTAQSVESISAARPAERRATAKRAASSAAAQPTPSSSTAASQVPLAARDENLQPNAGASSSAATSSVPPPDPSASSSSGVADLGRRISLARRASTVVTSGLSSMKRKFSRKDGGIGGEGAKRAKRAKMADVNIVDENGAGPSGWVDVEEKEAVEKEAAVEAL